MSKEQVGPFPARVFSAPVRAVVLVCPARRVYAAEIDEYVSGLKMLCTVCKQGSDRLKADWQLRDYYEDVEQAEAAWKAKTYTYRSYNKESLKLYAERYPGCAPPTH